MSALPIELTKPEEWHAERLKGVGSSDAGMVAGVGFEGRGQYYLWQLKTRQRPPEDLSGNKRVIWGTIQEDTIAAYMALEHPDWNVTRRRATQWSKLYPWAFAHLDRVVTVDGITVPAEIKTAEYEGQWGEHGTSDIPFYYVPQIQHELAVTDKPFAIVVVLIAGNDYREYRVPRNEAYIAHLMELERTFMEHVESRTPPPAQNKDDVLAQFPVSMGQAAADEATCTALMQYVAAGAEMKRLKELRDTLYDAIAVAFGKAEALTSHGAIVATFKTATRTDLDVTRLALERPEIAAEYARESSYRTLLPKAKALAA